MIELMNDYYVDVDDYDNYSLRKKIRTIDKETGEEKEYFKDVVAHNGSLKRAIWACCNRIIADNLKDKDLTLKEAITEIDKSTQMLINKINEALPTIRISEVK